MAVKWPNEPGQTRWTLRDPAARFGIGTSRPLPTDLSRLDQAVTASAAYFLQTANETLIERTTTLGTVYRLDLESGTLDELHSIVADPDDPGIAPEVTYRPHGVFAGPDDAVACFIEGTNYLRPSVLALVNKPGYADSLVRRHLIWLPPQLGAKRGRLVDISEDCEVQWIGFTPDGRLRVLTRTHLVLSDGRPDRVLPYRRRFQSDERTSQPVQTLFELHQVDRSSGAVTPLQSWTRDGDHLVFSVSSDQTRFLTYQQDSSGEWVVGHFECYDLDTQRVTSLDLAADTHLDAVLPLTDGLIVHATPLQLNVREVRRVPLDGSPSTTLCVINRDPYPDGVVLTTEDRGANYHRRRMEHEAGQQPVPTNGQRVAPPLVRHQRPLATAADRHWPKSLADCRLTTRLVPHAL